MTNQQYGFHTDTSRCIKCWACTVGCKQWHEIKAGGVSRRKVEETTSGTFPDVSRLFVSLSCMHCESPACLSACPQGAISKREEDGVVVVDSEKCIGCKTCESACPYNVPQYSERTDGGKGLILNKCDTCLSLDRAADGQPHCVLTCPMRALQFGPLSEMEKLASAKGGVRMEGETRPAVFLS